MNERIGIFLPSLFAGGAERVTLTLANGMAEQGHKVDLLLAQAEGAFLKDVSPAVNLVDLRAPRLIRSTPRLASYLRSVRPAALLSVMNDANLVAIAARRLAGVPTRLVVAEHTTPSVMKPKNFRSRFIPALMRLCYGQADKVVAVSEGVARDLMASTGLPADKLEVVYNPVVSPALIERSHEPVEHPWFAPGQPPVLMAAGRLHETKDFPNLLRAFARLRSGRPARLMILGEGELRPELEALVRQLRLEQDVSLPGFVSNPCAWIRRAAVFVLSSRQEGLPTAMIEAMACGTPVVSTDCPSGPAEILEKGRWGRLAPVGEPRALADAIAATLDSPSHPNVAARAADFTVDKAIAGYLRVLQIEQPSPQGRFALP
ncbi:glycosyltransferase [Caldimonas tepidiphila]|uniref:glycosyltransferase n=1 Tax=Caldimonas tepidiphila TaxID=2315841 RepID=UPI000E5C31D9|nr:glycosyltransferase [Caldimonas tepidiphila]